MNGSLLNIYRLFPTSDNSKRHLKKKLCIRPILIVDTVRITNVSSAIIKAAGLMSEGLYI